MRSLAMVMGAVTLGSMLLGGCGAHEDAASADQGLTESDGFVTDLCGARGWVSTASFQTLAGSYVRTGTAAKGVIATITFSDTSSPDHLRVGGTFASTLEGGGTSAGAFSSLPDNAAFPANILLDPTGALATGAPSASSAMYYTLGMTLDAKGDISALCLEHMLDASTAEPAIVIERAPTGIND